ncbi:MAG: DUF2752 domain-containing protein [Clostridia bacterium]|nr:DUF2752 domain-containing protein [Clostridia bacterium]
MKRNLLYFLYWNLALLLLTLLFWGYVALCKTLTGQLFCVFKILTKSYCPFCGGTRSLYALLHFDLPAALRYNALVVVTAVMGLVYEINTLAAILRCRPRPFALPRWAASAYLAVFFVFFLGRNLLLWCGIDIIGDFIH